MNFNFGKPLFFNSLFYFNLLKMDNANSNMTRRLRVGILLWLQGYFWGLLFFAYFRLTPASDHINLPK